MRVVLSGYHPVIPRLAWPDPTILTPHASEALRLVIALERCGWSPPDWECTLRVYGSGDERRVYLSEIKGHVAGERFVLRFDFASGASIGDGFLEHRSLSMAALPGAGNLPPMRIGFDDSGARTLSVYTGTMWPEAVDLFASDEPCLTGVQDYERRDVSFYPVVSFENLMDVVPQSLDQNYGYTPSTICREEISVHTAEWLRRATGRLMALPERRIPIDSLCGQSRQPLDTPFQGWLLTTKTYAGRVGARTLEPHRRWVALPNRPLLLTADQSVDTANVLAPAWRPMCRLVAERPNPEDPQWLPVFRCGLRRTPHSVHAVIRDANNGWVVDLAAGDEARARAFEGRAVLSDLDASEIRVAVARTMVPLSTYKGGHKRACLLLERELRTDEVESVEGPAPAG